MFNEQMTLPPQPVPGLLTGALETTQTKGRMVSPTGSPREGPHPQPGSPAGVRQSSPAQRCTVSFRPGNGQPGSAPSQVPRAPLPTRQLTLGVSMKRPHPQVQIEAITLPSGAHKWLRRPAPASQTEGSPCPWSVPPWSSPVPSVPRILIRQVGMTPGSYPM